MFSRAASWGVLIGVWAVIGGLLTLELYLTLATADKTVTVGSVALGQFMRVSLWAALTPVVFWLQRTIPIHKNSWGWAVPVHLVLSVAAMALIYLIRLFVAFMHCGESLATFWHDALSQFYGRNLVDVPIYWTVLGTGFTIGIARRYREERLRAAQLEKDLAQAEMKALKAQLHPHFLFNTLNTISVLVRDKQSVEALSLITRLSALLRMALETTGQQEVPVRQELDFLRRYLEIQEARFSDRLAVKFSIDPATLDALLPNLILQPLAENAVIHGLSSGTDGGCVEVVTTLEGDRLHIIVRDDGPGFDLARGAPREGIGLSNTRGRLHRLYGAEASLECRNRAGGGAEVSIHLPLRSRFPGTPPLQTQVQS